MKHQVEAKPSGFASLMWQYVRISTTTLAKRENIMTEPGRFGQCLCAYDFGRVNVCINENNTNNFHPNTWYTGNQNGCKHNN